MKETKPLVSKVCGECNKGHLIYTNVSYNNYYQHKCNHCNIHLWLSKQYPIKNK